MKRIITNYAALATNPARRHALKIAERGYQSIAIGPVFARELQLTGSHLSVHEHTFNLDKYEHIYVIGAGKGSSQAAAAIESKLSDRITAGAVNDVVIAPGLSRITGFQGTHPLPSKHNLAATDRMLDLAGKAKADDLVITIICGGGSALFTRPAEGLSIEDLAQIRLHLLQSGASIHEINTVYKHTSAVHGGHLALKAFPATVLTLAVSDVPHDDPFVIASAPTLFDRSSAAEAQEVASKYGLHDLPLVETPDEDQFSGPHAYVVLASAELAIKAMTDEARSLGYAVESAGSNLTMPAEELASQLALRIAPGKSVVFAGEPPVVVTNPLGQGGRMQHLAVSALPKLNPHAALAACASDGSDFINGVAGAIVDGAQTAGRCHKFDLDPAEATSAQNAYPLLKTTGDLLAVQREVTANVSDFGIILQTP
jgi:glycerate 2-kinase